ncbi:MAG: trypsin-like peptidase domain-containing protein [Planctomycetes bacterium]|jgi:serine protease Do|nr:trypsin-like peptidase domain-containing protein [Planctomycetota bacterium]
MRFTQSFCAAILAAAVLVPFSSATEKVATPSASASRITPIVRAVEKTEAGVVAIRVAIKGQAQPMIGSGVIVDESGLIVTNRHVTQGMRYLDVQLHNGTKLLGEVVATDSDLDLAIVRINVKSKLTALPLGPTGDMKRGEDVIAIGSPFGFDATVTRGIISALNRKLNMPNDVVMTGLIQHDAPINPGNSGGPLVNMNAEVIGINVAMRDGGQNIAFAINAGTVRGFLNKYLKRVSKVQHGLKVEETIIAQVGDRSQVVVSNKGHKALKAGDIILAVESRKVANQFDLERALLAREPGQQVKLNVVRQGQETIVMLTLEASHGAGSVVVASREAPAGNSPITTQGGVRVANGR